MDTPIERAPLAPDLSQARYAVDLTGLVPAEVAAGLPACATPACSRLAE